MCSCYHKGSLPGLNRFSLCRAVRVDNCKVTSGIIYVVKNGLRWRDAPLEYGPCKTWTPPSTIDFELVSLMFE